MRKEEALSLEDMYTWGYNGGNVWDQECVGLGRTLKSIGCIYLTTSNDGAQVFFIQNSVQRLTGYIVDCVIQCICNKGPIFFSNDLHDADPNRYTLLPSSHMRSTTSFPHPDPPLHTIHNPKKTPPTAASTTHPIATVPLEPSALNVAAGAPVVGFVPFPPPCPPAPPVATGTIPLLPPAVADPVGVLCASRSEAAILNPLFNMEPISDLISVGSAASQLGSTVWVIASCKKAVGSEASASCTLEGTAVLSTLITEEMAGWVAMDSA